MAKQKPKYIATTTLIDGDPNLRQIAALGNPGSDQMLFRDNATGEFAYLTPGTNMSIVGTSLDGTGASQADAIAFAIALG